VAPRHDERIVYERHTGSARTPLGATYRRREPERTVLYGVVQDHLQRFLAEARAEHPEGRGLPSFIERELSRYLECGILRAIFASQRKRARRQGIVGGRLGSVTFIQRFGSALNHHRPRRAASQATMRSTSTEMAVAIFC